MRRVCAPSSRSPVETLQRHHRDAFDFHEVPVWAIEAALVAAYDAGRASVRGHQ